MYLVIFVIILIILILVHFYFNFFRNINLKNCKKYLINLDRRKDRLEETTKLLKNYGYNNLNRFSAIDGNIININDENIIHPESITPIINKKREHHHELSTGAVGCYLSHLNIWGKLYNDNLCDYYLIFEDDTFPTITLEEMNKILKNVPHDWDIILFGGFYNSNENNSNSKFDKVFNFFGMHAYMINKNKLSYIIKNALPMTMQIDSWLSNLSINNIINIYIVKNSNWLQNNNNNLNSTDIQTPLVNF